MVQAVTSEAAQPDLVKQLLSHNLAVSAASRQDRRGAETLLGRLQQPLSWGVGPPVAAGDLVLIYFHKGFAKELGTADGLRFVIIADNDAYPARGSPHWNYLVDAAATLAFDHPVTIDLLRQDPVLRDWRLTKSNFSNTGSSLEFVDRRQAEALWRLLLRQNPAAAEPLQALLRSVQARTDLPLESLSREVASAVATAEAVREQMKAEVIGVEHLLLGLCQHTDADLWAKLERGGLRREELLASLKETTSYNGGLDFGPLVAGVRPAMSDLAAKAIEASRRLAVAAGAPRAQPIHLWHALFQLRADSSLLGSLPEVQLPPIPADEFLVGTRALRDTWTREDLLGYELYAQAIADPILQGTTQPPITIGIQAPWGQGKTSLMRMIQERLDPGGTTRDERALAQMVLRGTVAKFSDLMGWLDRPASPPRAALPTGVEPLPRFHLLPDGRARRPGFLPTRDEHQERVPTVWFNPLYYQEKEQVWAGMAHAILHQLSGQIDDPLVREKFWVQLRFERLNPEAIRRDLFHLLLARVAPRSVLYGLVGVFLLMVFWGLSLVPVGFIAGALATLGGPVAEFLIRWFRAQEKRLGDLDERFERYVTEPDYESRLGFLHLVDRDMSRALELLAGDYPIAVFVDDLDRCDPEVVNKVILAINQFLSLPHRNTIFFLGMDRELVAAALEKVRGVESSDQRKSSHRSFGWEFMDKFVQVPFVIPRLDPQLAGGYMEKLLVEEPQGGNTRGSGVTADLEEIAATESVEKLSQKAAETLSRAPDPRSRQAVQQAVSRRTTELLRDPQGEEIQRLVKLAVTDLDLNPRAMKRYLNLVRLLRNIQVAMGNRRGGDTDRKIVLRAAHLLIMWPKLVRWCQESPEQSQEGEPQTVTWIKATLKEQPEFAVWTEKAEKKWGKEDAKLLADRRLFGFLQRIQSDPPGLVEIYHARLF